MSTTISGTDGIDKATNQAVKDAMGVTGTAPIFGCRAWVNFDGTRNEADTGASVIGQNVKIRGSGNVSSVLKNAVGDYTVNFITGMPDANFVTFGYADVSSNLEAQLQGRQALNTTTSCTIWNRLQANAVFEDTPYVSVSIFR